jgi:hypothetical protein
MRQDEEYTCHSGNGAHADRGTTASVLVFDRDLIGRNGRSNGDSGVGVHSELV